MSATAPLRRPAALRLPATAPSRTTAAPKSASRPRLVLISQRRTTAGRLPFMILIGGVLSIGLVAVLLLHMVAAQDAYRANALQQQLASLTDQEQQLATSVEANSSPSALRTQALAYGMRPTTVTSFRQLKDGRAVGVQTPILAPPPVTHTETAGKSDATAKNAKAGKTATNDKPATTSKTTPTKHHKATTGP